MQIAVLASGDGWHVRDLARAANYVGHDLVPISFLRLQAKVSSSANNRGCAETLRMEISR